jgi:hypothetical protein
MLVRDVFPDFVVFYERQDEDWQLEDALTVQGNPFNLNGSDAPYRFLRPSGAEYTWNSICDVRLWRVGDWHNQLAISWFMAQCKKLPVGSLTVVKSHQEILLTADFESARQNANPVASDELEFAESLWKSLLQNEPASDIWEVLESHNEIAFARELNRGFDELKPSSTAFGNVSELDRSIMQCVSEFPGKRAVDYSRKVETASVFTDSFICDRILSLVEAGVLQTRAHGANVRLSVLELSQGQLVANVPALTIGNCTL